MKPSDREIGNTDFLCDSFVTIPHLWLMNFSTFGLSSQEFVLLLQILSAQQVSHQDFLSPVELGSLCGMSPNAVSDLIEGLVTRGFLAIGVRIDGSGTQANYFDLQPLWARLRGQNPLRDLSREWHKDPISLFEEEFGRPLSGLECEQVRQWLERDRHPEWIVNEALREAVLANKYSFKYIDRILYDWQRHRIRTRQQLETYRQGYRERAQAREEVAAANRPTRGTAGARATTNKPGREAASDRDGRYSAFYQASPDA